MELITLTPKTTPEFETLYWLATAASNDRLKPNLRCINVRKGLVVATDGYRLHQYDGHITGLFPGTYRVHKQLVREIRLELVELDYPYPHTDSAWPDTGDWTEVSLPNTGENDLEITFAKIVRAMSSEAALNHRFFTDAVRGEAFTGYVNPEDFLSPVVLLNGERKALVMPIRSA
ncbi:hypothetical protein LCGC14_1715350 [marine sediment metagenome]|uniref:DNA polymerase III beta sliding clamp central domain-containing protein n=1 Tax=marine sediment metagenome TaxID=412755 RepID=A0A0F9I1K2_9ZZZZ